MLTIAAVLPLVTNFLTLLAPGLSAPQTRHLAALLQGLILHEGHKTLARLARLVPGPASRSAAADFLTESPWDERALMGALVALFFGQALALAARLPASVRRGLRVVARLDDTIIEKPKASTHFAGADWHFDHAHGRHVFGYVLVTLSVSLGPFTFPLGLRLYLRASTCRKLRRRQAPPTPDGYSRGEAGLRFRSKLALARELLDELTPHLAAAGLPVYVMFDAWYSAKSLIRFCRQQRWQVIGSFKSNRKLEGRQVRQHVATFGKAEWSKVAVTSSVGSQQVYRVASKVGRLTGLRARMRVVFSLRDRGGHEPLYLFSTDLSLSAAQIVQLYSGRWLVEILHWHLKVKLGLGDFRVRSLRGVGRYAVICLLAQALLEWGAWGREGVRPCDVIGQLRREHGERLLKQALRRAKRGVRTQTILETTTPLLV